MGDYGERIKVTLYDSKDRQEEKEFNIETATLEEVRKVIDQANRDIVDAFVRRNEAVKRVAIIKAENNMPILDKGREQIVIDNISKLAPDELKGYTERLFRGIMSLSREYQGEKIEEYMNSLPKKPFGLLGRKLGYSISPQIHKRIGEIVGQSYEYKIFEKEPEEIEAFLKSDEWQGLNVTIPYKQTVIPYLDRLTTRAKKVGAVNTIVRVGNELVGDNTDAFGIVYTFEKYGAHIHGMDCLVLGAGGASKAVQAMLKDLGAARVTVLGHKEIDNGMIDKYLDYDILVNATPVGVTPFIDNTCTDPRKFFALRFVMDLIYNPRRTKLLTLAKMGRINCASGLDMLVAQAVEASELFRNSIPKYENPNKVTYGLEPKGKKTAEEKMAEKAKIIEKIVSEYQFLGQNIVLIGMPGSGKSTVGKMLAERTGRDFHDTDEMVEYRTGRTPEAIIKEDGEVVFRKYESDACSVLSGTTNNVIATGGGVILKNANFEALAQGSVFVFLKRSISNLAREGRPLSNSVGLEKLAIDRMPKYNAWQDITIETDGKTVEEIVDEIITKIGEKHE